MKHHNDERQEVSSFSTYHHFSRRHALLFLCIFCLATMACGIFGTGSSASNDAIVMRTRLPTFTPTSLPTLTPTILPPIATEAAVASLPTTADAPTQDLVPTNTLIPPVEPDEPGSIPITAEPAANIETVPTGVTPEPATNTTVTGAAGTPAAVVANPTATIAASPTALPTNSPTAVPSPTALPTNTATPLPTEPPTPTPEPEPTATRSISTSPGWSFANLRTLPAPDEDGLLVYGNVTNDTGVSQEVWYITGQFFDDQGQLIADRDRISDYWPFIDTIPPRGSMPFELFVEGIQTAANFTLGVDAEANGDHPHQDFEFSDVNPSVGGSDYCLKGAIQNRGNQLEEYRIVAATIYDSQDNVINFNDDEELDDLEISTFEICIDAANQNVARYELQAWGR